jgi:RimJ/RimL family protein N-acetyltransferase
LPVPSIPLDLTLADGELTLSRPTEDDVDTLVTACNDPEIQRFTQVPTPYTRDSARWFVDHAATSMEAGSELPLLVRDRDGRMLASCGLVDLGWRDLDGEVGFWVAPWARRQGVATHAARVVCRWAFEEAGIERLDLEAATINPGSNGVARRLGFTLEGTRRAAAIEGATGEPGTERMDMNVWGLLPGELT